MTETRLPKRRRGAKTHDLGPFYLQLIWAPYEWNNKRVVRGWSQETDEPFRTSTPLLLRLPGYRALVLGKWTGRADQTKIDEIIGLRVAQEHEFTEEAGWAPPPREDREEMPEDGNFGPHWVGITQSLHS